jgi:phage major head subunit gpT-like protein
MIITTQTLKDLSVGFRTQYMEAYQGGAPKVGKYAMRTTSRSAKEFYGWLGSVPGMRRFLGEADIRNATSHAFGVPNEEFHDTISVKRIDITRDQFGMYNMLFPSMGLAARQHPDSLLATAMVGGFTTPCYTGKNFFDADHEPQAGKTKFSNKGTKKLSRTNYRTARQSILSRRNAEGRPMNLGIDLQLIVSPKWEAEARDILESEKIGGGNSNPDRGTAKVEMWTELSTNEDAWFLVENGQPVKAFVEQVEIPTEFATLTDLNSERVIIFKEFIYQAYGSYAVAALMPELAYGSTGADAA